MTSPRIDIDLQKIGHNTKVLKELYGSKEIGIFGVTKVVCGNPEIAQILVDSGIDILADSRISNIKRMREAGIKAKYLLLRTPSTSQTEEVIKFADISLNSELSVVKSLSHFAVENKIIHKIILMVELGDLREGIMPLDLEDTVREVLKLKGIELAGIGTNLSCFGGIKPDVKNMNEFSSIARDIESKFGLKLAIVSGGNSANYNWFNSSSEMGLINNLRLGESIFLGCETLNRKHIIGLFTDIFKLVAEVIEFKTKPSSPYGDRGQDAFGNIPVFKDNGQIKRAILGIGLQDVKVSGLTPHADIEIIGTSSDHVIVNAKHEDLKVGSEVAFNLNYGALLSAMTSPYINKNMII